MHIVYLVIIYTLNNSNLVFCRNTKWTTKYTSHSVLWGLGGWGFNLQDRTHFQLVSQNTSIDVLYPNRYFRYNFIRSHLCNTGASLR